MLSGPEVSRILHQFEDQYLSDSDPEDPNAMQNHETGRAAQVTFQRQVNKLYEVIKRMGNPFLNDFVELVTLDSRDCADPNAAESVRKLEEIGEQQYLDFVQDVIVDQTKSIHETIKKNSLPLYGKCHAKSSSKKGKQIAVLKGNVALFAQLYVAMQNRDGDTRELFCHEVQSFPPSLSEYGNLRLPSAKSELLNCLKQPEFDPPNLSDCKVLDGAVIVHSLPTVGVSTFDDYADKVFIPHLQQQLKLSNRVDVVWDRYTIDSLKETTREKRGHGIRRKVSGHVKLPKNWMQFLRDPDNKSELFEFLSSKVASCSWPSDRAIYITSGTSVISSDSSQRLMPECNHEEADTRIVVHVVHALEGGAKSVIVRTVDTDVVIILVGKFHDLCVKYPQAQIWVAFGMGKHFNFMSINGMCSRLGEAKSRALPVFHAFTGCDTTSSFCGKGKKSAWQAWESNDHVTPALTSIAAHPFQPLSVNSENFKSLERMTILLYDKHSPAESVNEARMAMFCKQNRTLENIPPTQDALLQHTRRAVYQAGIWTSSDQSQLRLPSPEEFGWTRIDGSWKPNWMSIPKVSKVCRELVKCACKRPCSRCKCAREQLPQKAMLKLHPLMFHILFIKEYAV